ncbi:MAG: ATP synthase F1 subunit epsilon [Bulleidia sp.]|nr:ATP synthase F1 subunit epsilon [Bulleidia sp.]
MSTFHVRVVTPHGVYREWDTAILNIQTSDGDQGILANHMPLVTMLKIGKMTSDIDGKREEFAVAGGLFYFRENLAEVLTDAIENKVDIDIARAEKSKERAEERLRKADPSIDIKRAEVSLKKAMNRLSVGGK